MLGERLFGGAIAAAIAVLAFSASPALASTCSVSTPAGLTSALSNFTCDPVVLAAGTYSESTSPAFTATRPVTLTGAGVGQTILTRTGSGSILRIGGSNGDQITVTGMTIGGATAGRGVDINSGAAITVDLKNVAVSGNTTGSPGGSGAGISFTASAGGVLNVTDSTISDNTENTFQGGGFSTTSAGVVNFNRVLFFGNRSNGGGGGGALNQCVTGATTNLTNVTFTDNHAKNNGGAIRNCSNATINVVASTVAGNVADDDNAAGGGGGGIANELGTVSIRDSILAGNSDVGGGAPDCSGTITRKGYVLVKDPTGCTFGGAGDTAAGYRTGVDPLLGPLSDNGGATRTMALLPGSPAIDAIPPASCATSSDQRSETRPKGPGCDLGAFEREAAITPPPPGSTDVTPPQTTLDKAKIKKDKRKAKFGFSSSEASSTFECSLDDKPLAPCTSPRRYKHLKRGKHTFQVAAIDAAGNVDPTPVQKKFKIKG